MSEDVVREIVRRMLGSGSVTVQAFPVGAVYVNVSGVNPATELGYGTWADFGGGRALVGFSGVAPFDVAEAAIGAATHSHTYTDVPNHTHDDSIVNNLHSHTVPITTGNPATATGGSTSLQGTTRTIDENKATSSDVTTVSLLLGDPVGGVATGTTATASTLPPSIVVYFWKRTA